MGNQFIAGFQELDIPLRDVVSMHFSSNMYPPVPQVMVESAVEAINLCNSGEYYEEVTLPEGVSYRGKNTVAAATLVEQHRLEGFVDWE